MNLKVINEKVKSATLNSQPSLTAWIERLKEPQPMQPSKRKLGACVANDNQNKKQKVDENVIEFENFVRANNKKFNAGGRKFNHEEQLIKIKHVNVNSVQSFQKMNKVRDY